MIIEHPDFPLLSSCRLQCLNRFGLRPDTWHALRRELGHLCTLGELAEWYEEDLTAIRGIGPSRAYDLARVLAAAGYPSPLEAGKGQDARCRWSPCRGAGTAGGCERGCTGE